MEVYMIKYSSFFLILVFAAGCVTPGLSPSSNGSTGNSGLFSSMLSGNELEVILASTINLPDSIKVAVLKIPSKLDDSKYHKRDYWSSEGYINMQQQYKEILTDSFSTMENIGSIIFLPSLMINDNMTIQNMREASARLQCNILVAYKVTSDIFTNYISGQEEGFKAYATCEAFLLHTKSGAIPFSISITETFLAVKNADDANKEVTMKRAEQEATILVLQRLVEEINLYFFPAE
jgi:hypothetical protein